MEGAAVTSNPEDQAPRERAAESARRLRAEMTAPGLRPCDPPLPDLKDPEVQEWIRRACAAINDSPDEQKILEELESIEIEGWVYDWE